MGLNPQLVAMLNAAKGKYSEPQRALTSIGENGLFVREILINISHQIQNLQGEIDDAICRLEDLCFFDFDKDYAASPKKGTITVTDAGEIFEGQWCRKGEQLIMRYKGVIESAPVAMWGSESENINADRENLTQLLWRLVCWC